MATIRNRVLGEDLEKLRSLPEFKTINVRTNAMRTGSLDADVYNRWEMVNSRSSLFLSEFTA